MDPTNQKIQEPAPIAAPPNATIHSEYPLPATVLETATTVITPDKPMPLVQPSPEALASLDSLEAEADQVTTSQSSTLTIPHTSHKGIVLITILTMLAVAITGIIGTLITRQSAKKYANTTAAIHEQAVGVSGVQLSANSAAINGEKLIVNGDGNFSGDITARNFKGEGSGITNLNVANCAGCVQLQPRAPTVPQVGNINISGALTASEGDLGILNTGAANISGNSIIGGRLGIGTLAPAFTVDVAGDVNLSNTLKIGGNTICTAAGCTPTGGGTSVVNSVNGLTGSLTIQGSGNGIAVSSGGNTISLALPQSLGSGDSPTFAGLTLSGPLPVTSGGTGAASLSQYGVIVGNGSGALNAVTAGGANLCLISNASANPSFQSCPGSGGVSSVNGLTGALTVANSSGSGTTITINDASTIAKGIAQFNATNFSVSSGAVNTIQNIAVTSAPTFAGLTLNGNLTLGAANTIFANLLQHTGNGQAVTIDAGNDQLTLSANGRTYILPTTGGASQTICTTAITCASGGGQAVLLAPGSAQTNNTADSAIFINGTSSGALLQLQQSGTNKFVVAANGDTTIGGALGVNTITPSSALTIGATGQAFTLQGNASSAVSVSGNGFTTTLNFNGTATANVTYSLDRTVAAGTYTICSTAGNCAGVGGGVTTAGGTAGKLAKFTGAQGIGDSLVSESGSTVTVGGTLSVNVITPTAALTVGATGQNLTLQGTSVNLTSTSGGITNALTFATPSGSNKTITLPNATGTVAVSASGPLALDAAGNLTCASCLTTGGGGGTTGVSSVNTLTGAVTVQGTTNQVIVTNGANIVLSLPQDITATSSPTFDGLNVTTIDSAGLATLDSLDVTNDATVGGDLDITGAATAATFNGLTLTANADGFSVAGGTTSRTLTVTDSNVTLNQNLRTTDAPTFAGLTLGSPLTVGNGGTGATSASGARTNLGAAASGANGDITSLTALTAITPGAALTIGATGQSLTLQGSAATTLVANDSGNTTTVGFATPTANVTYLFQTTTAGTYNICTTAGNCAGVGGGVTTAGGTAGKIAKFTGSQTLGDSIITESGSTITIGGTLAVNTLTPTGALTVGATGQNLTLQGATVSLTATSGGITNTLTFATPATSNKTITIPNATGTVAVSASGPLSLDANGNLTCSTCLTGGGGGGSGVSSVNTLTGAVVIQGTANQVVVTNGANIVLSLPQDIDIAATPTFGSLTVTNAVSAGSLSVTGAATAATFNGLTLTANADGFSVAGGTTSRTLTVTGSNVTLNQNLRTTDAPTFAGATLNGDATLAAGFSLKVTGSTSFPGSPSEGQIYFRTDTKQLYVYANGKWQADRSTATKIVADGSTSQNPEAADYVVSAGNTSAQTTINAAISALPATGGTVYLREGTYTIDGSISLPSNVTLAGSGSSSTIIKIKNSIATNVNAIVNSDAVNGNTNITIRDLALDGNVANRVSGNQLGMYLEKVGSSSKGGALITNLELRNFRNEAIYAHTSSNLTIESNTFNNDGFGVGFDGTTSSHVAQNSINNTSSTNAIYILNSSNNNTFANNTINTVSGGTGTGFTVGGSSSNNTISGNTVLSTSGSGIFVNITANYNTVSGNTIKSTGANGILISGSYNTVTGNTSQSNAQRGIQLVGADSNVVSSNTFIGNTEAGIYLSSANNTVITGNRVHDNGGSGAFDGIFLVTSDNNQVTTNNITDTAGTGYAINISNSASDNTYLADNTYSGTGATAINNAGTGTVYGGQLAGTNYILQPAGNVGIGQATASYKLDVAGDVNISSGSAYRINGVAICTSGGCTAASGSSNYIQNGTSPQTADFNITGTGTVGSLSVTGAATAASFNGLTLTANADGFSIAGGTTSRTLTVTGSDVTLNQNLRTTDAPTFAGLTLNSDATLAAGVSLKVTGSTSLPSSPTEGQVYFRTDTKQLYVYANGQWQADRSTATKIVSDGSTSQNPEAADFVVPAGNTSAQTTINNAITALPSGGGIIYLREGTYTIDGAISLPSNVTLAGSGDTTIIKLKAGITSSFSAIQNADPTNGNTRMVVRDLQLDGNRTNISSGSQSGFFITKSGSGSGTTAVPGITIDSVSVKNFRAEGIALDTTSNSRVTGNSVVNNATFGIDVDPNTVVGSVVVSSNNIQGTGQVGIYVGDNTGGGCVISGNYVASSGLYGIMVDDSDGNSVTGNTLRSNTQHNIYLEGTSEYNSIVGNTTEGGADGIYLISISTSRPNNNTISGNTVRTATANGILIAGGNNNLVTGNKIYNVGGSGANSSMWLFDADNTTITGNSIVDTAGTAYAIDISDSASSGTYLADNTYSGTGATTINNSGTSTIYAGQIVNGNYIFQSVGNVGIGTSGTPSQLLSVGGTTGNLTINTSGNLVTSGTMNVQNTSTGALLIQKASAGTALLTADTTNMKIKIGNGTPTLGSSTAGGLYVTDAAEFAGQIRIGDATNNVNFDGTTHEFTLNGTARHTKNITLTAEYAGTTLDADGTNNTGTMTSAYDGTNRISYYKWTTTQATAQDYDVILQIPVPSDWSAWSSSTPITIKTYSSNTTTGTILGTLTATNGTVETNWNTCALTPGSNSTWATVTGCSVTGTYAADGIMTLRLHITSPQNGDVRIGDIVLTYLSKY